MPVPDSRYRLSIAPMVDITDKHFRRMCRFLTRKTLIYTEMIAAPAIINGNREKLLRYHEIEAPIAVQVAGSDKKEIGEACRIIERYGFEEVNLNAGCPSLRVSEYDMGASLMAYPDKVADISEAMLKNCTGPVTIKHRLGIDGRGLIPDEHRPLRDSYEDLKEFVETVKRKGVNKFIIHARIAILKGLNPGKNRSIPELDYDKVYRLKEEFPDLHIEMNGGIRTLESIKQHLQKVDSVMLARVAYENPMILAFLDDIIDCKKPETTMTRRRLIEHMIDYSRELEDNNERSIPILKHMYGLFHGKRGSRKWRQSIMPPYNTTKASGILMEAMQVIENEILDEVPDAKDF
ncbi:MAG: tRNA dihydrouridine(20/20a) synthase DusA [Candidatus Woesearchaeota archaeon]